MDQQDNWWLLLLCLFLNDSNKEELKKLGVDPISSQLEEHLPQTPEEEAAKAFEQVAVRPTITENNLDIDQAKKWREEHYLPPFQAYPINPLSIPFSLYDFEQYTKEKKIQEECEQIEWEQDMGAHIPFCKLDGQFCNMQCIRRT